MKAINPFITNGYRPEEYFCDRVKETDYLIRQITNGNNVAVISPRRLGKTGLIEHCFHKKEIRDNYYTFLIEVKEMTSSKFLQVYKLTARSVQGALKGLLEKDFVTVELGVYAVYDRFFDIWLRRKM